MIDPEKIPSRVARARLREIPSLATFAEHMASAAEHPPEELWRCEQPFARLLESSFLADLTAWELACLRADADYLPSRNGEADMEILRLGTVTLNVRLVLPPFLNEVAQLYGTCEHTLLANRGAGAITVAQWRQGSEGAQDVLDRSRPLEVLPLRQLAPGEQLRFEAHRDVFRYGAADRPTVVVTLTRNRVTRLRWVYDAATLLPVRATGAESSAARLEYACALLVALNHTAAAPAIASLYDHPDHFVRWSAVRRTMDLDPTLGWQLVKRAASDVHPHVRRAAARSLERQQASAAPHVEET